MDGVRAGPRCVREYDDVDDRVVEVPDPEGNYAGLDVMAAVDDATNAPEV